MFLKRHEKRRQQEVSGRLTISHLVPSNSSLAGFFACNAAGFFGFGGVLAPTLWSLVTVPDRGGTRTRTQRTGLISSQRWVLVCHLRGIDLLQSLGDVSAFVDFSKDGGRSSQCRVSRWKRRAWGRRRRRRRSARGVARGAVQFEVCHGPALYRGNEICNIQW